MWGFWFFCPTGEFIHLTLLEDSSISSVFPQLMREKDEKCHCRFFGRMQVHLKDLIEQLSDMRPISNDEYAQAHKKLFQEMNLFNTKTRVRLTSYGKDNDEKRLVRFADRP